MLKRIQAALAALFLTLFLTPAFGQDIERHTKVASQFKDLELLTVFAVGSGIEKKEFAFKLLQSTSAIGVRIHRDGLPTLVAFKTNPAAGDATLTGFSFSGPVGVSVFKPKQTR